MSWIDYESCRTVNNCNNSFMEYFVNILNLISTLILQVGVIDLYMIELSVQSIRRDWRASMAVPLATYSF